MENHETRYGGNAENRTEKNGETMASAEQEKNRKAAGKEEKGNAKHQEGRAPEGKNEGRKAESAAKESAAEAQTKCETKLRELEAKLKEADDKYLRAVAEMDNTRKRTAKEMETLRLNVMMDTITPFLQVFDHFSMAVAASSTSNNLKSLLDGMKIDFLVDAIDTVTPKVMLLAACHQRGVPVVSSMGSGGKTDPSQIRLADISKTNYCPLAKVVRTRLAKMGIKHGITCVYSTEPIDKRCVLEVSGERYKKTTTGTVSYMPNLFGCWLASHVIREIVKQTENND